MYIIVSKICIQPCIKRQETGNLIRDLIIFLFWMMYSYSDLKLVKKIFLFFCFTLYQDSSHKQKHWEKKKTHTESTGINLHRSNTLFGATKYYIFAKSKQQASFSFYFINAVQPTWADKTEREAECALSSVAEFQFSLSSTDECIFFATQRQKILITVAGIISAFVWKRQGKWIVSLDHMSTCELTKQDIFMEVGKLN